MILSSDALRITDTQHRQLEELARIACHLLENEKDPIAFEYAIDQLLDFTAIHFRDEENVMQHHSYKGLYSHQRMHNYLLSKFRELKKEAFVFDELSRVRLLRFIKQEFKYHFIEDQHAWSAMAN